MKIAADKNPSTLREWIEELVNLYREQIAADIDSLPPLERLKIMEKLMAYALPKPQTISITEIKNDGRSRLEDRLRILGGCEDGVVMASHR